MPWPDFFFRKAKLPEPMAVAPKKPEEPVKAVDLSLPPDALKVSSPTAFPFRRQTRMTDVARSVVPPMTAAETSSAAPTEGPTKIPVDLPSTPAVEKPSAPLPVEKAAPPADTRPRQEFLLANGERILGHILSETPEALYINHPTLGVLTIQRSQIAKRLIEIILINGDRIVGDVMAETAESLYVRHASLGMITVPRSQRSTHVVEAVLKDGDRILGEILAETETFTVIRSATLGTVTIQHAQVAMLNRKLDQVQLRALPPSAALENANPPASNPTPETGPAGSPTP